MTRAFWTGLDWLDPVVDINAGERAETERRHPRHHGAESSSLSVSMYVYLSLTFV